MEDTGLYAPPVADLIAPEPGDDGPLPWEDSVNYPSIQRRLWRTVLCFVKRPIWFFHRVGLGSQSLGKPFTFFLITWSPLFSLIAIGGVVGLVMQISETRKYTATGMGLTNAAAIIFFGILTLVPLWYFGLLMGWGVAIHGAILLSRSQSPGPMIGTLRCVGYCAVWAFPLALLNTVVHKPTLYILGSALSLTMLLIPGLARLHRISIGRSLVAVTMSLGFMAALTWYAHHNLLARIGEALFEHEGLGK